MDSSGRVAVPPADEVLAADVAEVAYQAGVSEGVARDALARNEYEIVAAVLDLARCAGN
jgi:NACalpha-BTF3-like transcription factor|eukprot:COSAG02_NODE_13972_length_1325_cov_1.529364_1_plen_59_part_00